MKLLASLLLVSTFTSAHASFFQTNCSNPDATVVYLTGQVANKLLVTFKEVNGTGAVSFVKKELTNFDFKVLKTKNIENVSESTCGTSNATHGVISARDLEFKRVFITSRTGRSLPKNIVGLSADGTSLTVDYLCETNRNAQVLCQ
ncbi:MAG TPA: hypothetical protein VNJ01_18270 [Bacteriovoracaceae bacterium]|nr:hypothetical protein [Bacteriovoracaceae bacterium]